MSYYSDINITASSATDYTTQFEYVGIDNILMDCKFISQHETMLSFHNNNNGPDGFKNYIKNVLQTTNRKLIICLGQDPIDVNPFVEVLTKNFEPRNWFVLTNDFSKKPTENTAPWPYFLITQQFEKNLQLGKPKNHRIGFLCGVPRACRVQLWMAIKDCSATDDVVVVNSFCYDTMIETYSEQIKDFIKINPLPWSNCQQYLDQDQTLTCARAPTRNDHPAFNSYCNINAETCNDSGPLFFSEKTWKSYTSGCLTVNYGPVEAPTWLAAHGIELWSGDLPVSNQEKMPIIVDLFKSDSVRDLYHENLQAIEYNQHLVDSQTFLDRVLALTKNKLLTWANNQW
jgi:hypothetical protein